MEEEPPRDWRKCIVKTIWRGAPGGARRLCCADAGGGGGVRFTKSNPLAAVAWMQTEGKCAVLVEGGVAKLIGALLAEPDDTPN